jgi:hypothetical protein
MKTFLEFEDKLIDVYNIKDIEATFSWSTKENQMTYNIEINKQHIDSPLTLPKYKFEYKTEEQRNNALELMKIQLTGREGVEII